MKNIIYAENIEEARRKIEKIAKEGRKVVVYGRDIEFNRKVLETRGVSALILSHINKKDKLKQRDSGLNEVLCKIALDNNIALAVDFNEIKNSSGKQRAKILGRIIQNIMLCKKFKNKLIVVNKLEDKLSLAALLRVFGADTKTAKEAAN